MKFAIVTVLLGVVLICVVAGVEWSFDDMTPQMHSHVKACEEEKNVKKEECMKQLKDSNKKKLKLSGGCECMALCIGQKAGVVDDKGNIDNAKLEEHIDNIEDSNKKGLLKKIVADCKEKGIDIKDGCEAMNAVAQCSYVSYMARKDE